MSAVAVPDAVAKIADRFTEAAPGHVFQLYLPMWADDGHWTLDKGAKTSAAKASTRLPEKVRDLGRALRTRQQALAQAQQALTLQAVSTAPFATGLGNEHPIENGFAFLTPYGLPYLAGSGVKGVLRRAMQELRTEQTPGFSTEAINALFGHEKVLEPADAQRGALDFWDCLPEGPLAVDVMTPHHGGYYQKGQTPHDAGQPVPVPFLTVAPGAAFDFHVVCHEPRLPEALRGAGWRALLTRAFEHAFAWLGFGAKTAVGYGAMAENPEVLKRRAAEAAAAQAEAAALAEAARLGNMSPDDQAWDQAQPVLLEFKAAFDKARQAGAFNPSGPFNEARLKFLKTAQDWTEARSRLQAGELLEQSATKVWGRPSKKERWQELQSAIAALRGRS